ncbi:MAG TPA: (2Fe-2S) ferredoxin domain-containing protein [Syntrophobacter fumaroxidans]|nr:(2Fe-2S) ferredoxin domain-containing protein [Syntrophobacter fumaroxidans]
MTDTKETAELAICMGSSCFSRGNKHNIKIIKEYIDRHGLCGRVALKGHLCEGLCKDGPNITLNGEVFHSIDSASINVLLEENIRKQEE